MQHVCVLTQGESQMRI